mmetsp:Transcript_20404/g.39332  ORF Transcript_20404/g.39332 Transcript_20404/m.39332 type:complete len:119 (-) Transcript_20404:299-655(-)
MYHWTDRRPFGSHGRSASYGPAGHGPWRGLKIRLKNASTEGTLPVYSWVGIYLFCTFSLLMLNWIAIEINSRLISTIIFWAVLAALTLLAILAQVKDLEQSKTIGCLATPKEETPYAA